MCPCNGHTKQSIFIFAFTWKERRERDKKIKPDREERKKKRGRERKEKGQRDRQIKRGYRERADIDS